MKEHTLGKGKFRGKFYHCINKGHRAVDLFIKKKEVILNSNYGERSAVKFNR